MPLLPSPTITSRRARTAAAQKAPVAVRQSARIASAAVRRPGWTATDNGLSATSVIVQRLSTSEPLHPAGQRVVLVPEVLCNILSFCDWYTIMSVSRASQYGRAVAQMATRGIISRTIYPFITLNEFYEFTMMLDSTGAVVTGSVARRVLYANSRMARDAANNEEGKMFMSRDLNIVVPSGQAKACKAWFNSRGYGPFKKTAVQGPYSEVLRTFDVATRPQNGDIPVSSILSTFYVFESDSKFSGMQSYPQSQ